MKEPDIKVIRNKLGIPADDIFIGYVIFDTRYCYFLVSFDVYFNALQWSYFPEPALKIDSYSMAIDIINRLEIVDRAIFLMCFDLGAQIGVIPFEPEMMN